MTHPPIKLADLLDSLKRAFDAAFLLLSTFNQLARRSLQTIRQSITRLLGSRLAADEFLMEAY